MLSFKKMKKYNYIIIILILSAASLVSCKKQLEEYNPSGSTAQAVYNTPEGFETAVNAAYTYNRYFYGKEAGYGLFETGTDIWTSGQLDSKPELSTYLNLKTDQAYVTTLWQQCYAAINLCNTALSYENTAGLSAARRPVLEGELRFMRAWYYWHVVESFGDANFTLEPTTSLVTTANRTPVATIYDQIIADVTFAAQNLQNTPLDNNYGRVTKPAAEAFLARIYLTRGNNQSASNYANKVIKNYGFKLLTNYADLWNITNQRNSEVIWALNYSTNLSFNDKAGSNNGHMIFLMDYKNLPGMTQDIANGKPYTRYMPTKYLLNLFNETDDARFLGSFKQTWYANNATSIPKAAYKLGDTAVYCSKYAVIAATRAAKPYTIFDINDMYKANGTTNDRSHYISLRKFDDPTRATSDETQSSRDVFLIRLAEMYLIAGEAQLNLGKTDSAAYFINQLRSRAAITGHQTAMQVLPASITTDFILDERAREFAGEQLRWFDLKRDNKLVERVKKYNPDAAPYIQDYNALRPIPQAQIDAVTNKDTFKQNPGYQ
jgi:hypothetical protein